MNVKITGAKVKSMEATFKDTEMVILARHIDKNTVMVGITLGKDTHVPEAIVVADAIMKYIENEKKDISSPFAQATVMRSLGYLNSSDAWMDREDSDLALDDGEDEKTGKERAMERLAKEIMNRRMQN